MLIYFSNKFFAFFAIYIKLIVKDYYKRCVNKFNRINFKQCFNDSCLLIHFFKKIMLLLYVDDVIIVN